MIKTRQEKEEFVKLFEAELKNTKNFCLVGFQGLTVKQLEDLRKKLKTVDATFSVVKNRLVSRVFKTVSLGDFGEYLTGPTAIVLERGDPVKASKQLSTFSKSNENLKLKAGCFEGKFLTAKEISQIALLPSREQLISSVIRGMLFPVVGMMNVLSAPMRNLVVVLKQISDKGASKK
ncbi:MAG: 50S ribosomal protein L10 [Elusimicrobia bacterium]|nr:50S ribosomal protein L10 [Elusimicrobiota bacterium]